MPEKQTIVEPETKPLSPKRIFSWKRVLIGTVIALFLISFGAVFATAMLYPTILNLLDKSKEQTSTTTKIATKSGAATSSATKDETADWKVVTANNVGVTFKVPQSWTVNETPSTEIEEGVEISTVSTKSENPDKKATFAVNKNPQRDWNQTKTKEEKIRIAGLQARKVFYRADSDENQSWIVLSEEEGFNLLKFKGDQYFVYAEWDPGDEDSLKTLNQILSTFKFL